MAIAVVRGGGEGMQVAYFCTNKVCCCGDVHGRHDGCTVFMGRGRDFVERGGDCCFYMSACADSVAMVPKGIADRSLMRGMSHPLGFSSHAQGARQQAGVVSFC